jgi:hypothetical protein
MIRLNWPVLAAFALFMASAVTQAHAQQSGATTVATCGSVSYTAGRLYQLTQTQTGQLCIGAAGSSTAPAFIKPAPLTINTLDVKTVTTGGTAVTAISAGHRAAGGFLQNPIGATIALCINEIGTAVGTTSSGDTTCIQPGQSYTVAPASTAVSVITSDSSHPFSGYGLQ